MRTVEKCPSPSPSERKACSLCEDDLDYTLPADNGEERVCNCVGYADSTTLENLFEVRIAVFSLTGDGVANVEWSSRLPR